MEKIITNLEKIEIIVAAHFAHEHPRVAMEVRALVQEALQEIRLLTPADKKRLMYLYQFEQTIPAKTGEEMRNYFEILRTKVLPEHQCIWLDDGHPISVRAQGQTLISFPFATEQPNLTDFSFMHYDRVVGNHDL